VQDLERHRLDSMAVVTILLPLDVKPTNNPWFLGGLWECPLIDNHWHKGGRDLFQVAYRPIDYPGGFVRAPPNAARLGTLPLRNGQFRFLALTFALGRPLRAGSPVI
jgi:hypothetical protein